MEPVCVSPLKLDQARKPKLWILPLLLLWSYSSKSLQVWMCFPPFALYLHENWGGSCLRCLLRLHFWPRQRFLLSIYFYWLWLFLLILKIVPTALSSLEFQPILSLPSSESPKVHFRGMRSGHCWLTGLMDSLANYRTEEWWWWGIKWKVFP